jgi:hypothetical protein
MLFICMSNSVFAACDWSTGITPGPNKTYIYTEECHQRVGALVADNKVKEQQILDYQKVITMKDLAIKDSDARYQLWFDTSRNLEDRLQKVDSMQKSNEYLAFGLGVAMTFLAGYAAAKLIHP